MRIAVVDAVHATLGHQQGVRVQFQGALDGGVVGGDVGLADAACQQHDPAELQMTYGPQPDEGLGDALDRDGGHHPHVDVRPGGERSPQHQRIHDGAEHPDVVGFGPADAPALGHPATEVVPAADDDGYLHAEITHGQHLVRDAGQAGRVHSGTG